MRTFALIACICIVIFGLIVGGTISWIVVSKSIKAFKADKKNLGFVVLSSFMSVLFVFLAVLFLRAFVKAL